MARSSHRDDSLLGFRGAVPAVAKPDRVNGAELRKHLKGAMDSSDCTSCYIFINRHQLNASPAVLPVRSTSHHATAA